MDSTNSLTFQTLETLKIKKFWEILKTNNPRLLDCDYSRGKNYTDEQLEKLNAAWLVLYDLFISERDDKSCKYLISKNLELIKLSFKLDMLYEMENRLILLSEMTEEHYTEFKSRRCTEVAKDFKSLYPRVQLNIFSNLDEILNIVQQVIKSQTNIFDEKSGANDKNIKKQEDSIEYVVAIMSKALGFAIDSNSITCSDFIAYEKVVNSMQSKK